MWVPKWYFEAQARRANAMEQRIADLEEEQQQIRKLVKESIESNEDLIAIAKQIRCDLMKGISMEDLEDGDESK